MVAQDTICFCWLAPGPLIKHGVGETFIQRNPSPNKALCLIIHTWIHPYLLWFSTCVPWDWVMLGSPPRGGKMLSGCSLLFLSNWILKWPCGDIDLHLMQHTLCTQGDAHTSILPGASFTSSRLAREKQSKQRVRVLRGVEYLSELGDGWSLRVVLSRAIKAGRGWGRRR